MKLANDLRSDVVAFVSTSGDSITAYGWDEVAKKLQAAAVFEEEARHLWDLANNS